MMKLPKILRGAGSGKSLCGTRVQEAIKVIKKAVNNKEKNDGRQPAQ